MTFARSLLVSALFVLVAIGVAAWLYPQLPARVPTHWDLSGHVNGTMPRFWAAAFPALAVGVLALLTWLLPVVSPRRFRIGPFVRLYVGLMLAVQAMVLVIGVCILLAGAGFALSMPRVTLLAVGGLFMVLGNYMGKLRRNFFIGIRTPWTLASEATWERTHRFGGPLFAVGGAIVLLTTALGAPVWVPTACLLAAAAISTVYSFVVYRRLEHAPRR